MPTLQQLLGGHNLTGMIQGIKSGVPIQLPPQFLKPTRSVIGDKVTWHRVDGTRQLARRVERGAPARRADQLGITEVTAKCIHTFEEQSFEMEVVDNLMAPGSEVRQANGRQEISRQTAEFKQRFMNLRIACVQQAMATGYLHFGSAGQLLPSSSGAVVSIDYGIPASNRSQLDWDGNGDLLSASWATAGTPIIKEIGAIKKAALQLTGYPIKTALYGADLPENIAANTEAKSYLNANPDLSRQYVETGAVPKGFGGIDNWIPFNEAFWEDSDGTFRDCLAAANVVFLPAFESSWYELVQGSFNVPKAIGNVGDDGVAMLKNLVAKFGMFSYATVGHNPPTITQYAGDTFLPLIKVPNAVFIANTEF